MAWHAMKMGQQNSAVSGYFEFILDSAADINTEPTEFGHISMGSVAYTVESGSTAMDQMWMKASDGTWSEL